MNTPPVLHLPRPPLIPRARCECGRDRHNYLSSYCWYLNRALRFGFNPMYLDIRYGSLYFDDDRTTDCGEMKFDASDLTMNICGTEYTHSIGVYSTTFIRETISPELIKRLGTGVNCAESWTDYTDDPTYTAEDSPSSSYNLIQLRQLSLGGHQARSFKEYLKFDTSAADPDPTSATLRIRITTFDKSAGLGDPTLQIYSQDWGDEVDTDDKTGGSLVASQVISAAGAVELDVGTGSVTVGGDSKYRVTLEEIENGTTLGCEEYIHLFVNQLAGYQERLILGYGE